jgi:hypothetical protein
MAAKPIVELRSKGKVVVVDFAREVSPPTLAVRYDITINGRIVQARIFAEEVMRWLARELVT